MTHVNRSYLHRGTFIKCGALIAYVGTIFAANWAIQRFGLIPVGFGLLAPAGVYFVGLAFPLRDFIQRTMGRRWGVLAILAGGGLSYLVAPTFAVASGATFLVSESADMAVYTPLQKRFGWAVLASSAVALVVDSKGWTAQETLRLTKAAQRA